jgi:hypothetical protein
MPVNTEAEFEESPFSPDAEQQRLQKNFKDYLIATAISGGKSGYHGSDRIPAEHLFISPGIIEVQSNEEVPDPDTGEHRKSQIVLQRDENDEVVAIEVRCSCGTITLIHLNPNDSDIQEVKKQGVDIDELKGMTELHRQEQKPDGRVFG